MIFKDQHQVGTTGGPLGTTQVRALIHIEVDLRGPDLETLCGPSWSPSGPRSDLHGPSWSPVVPILAPNVVPVVPERPL